MATWLITGATGFLGRHVLDVLDFELVRAGRTGDAVLVVIGGNTSGDDSEQAQAK